MCIWKGCSRHVRAAGTRLHPNVLYHNLGGGHFANVSKSSGIEKTNGHYCLGVSTLDYNRDGWPDIYVACDSTPSILYRNNKDGTFTDVAVDAGRCLRRGWPRAGGYGRNSRRLQRRWLPRIFKTNFSDDTSSLYQNNGDGTYSSKIFDAGLALNTQYLGWGVMFFDMDNDGWPDLMLANGHVYPEVDTAHLGATYKEPRLVYWNQGQWKIQRHQQDGRTRLYRAESSRGLAIADLWNQGRISAVINNSGANQCCWSTRRPIQNHWIGISAVGTRSNRDGIGASVTVFAGDKKWAQEVRSGSSYISSSDLRLHFGLGTATRIDRVEIDWPSGLKESFSAPSVDRIITLTEGTGLPH